MERTKTILQGLTFQGSTAGSDILASVATLGAVAAGAAIFEVALVPAVLIGGAAVLAPDLVSKDTLRRVGSGLRRLTGLAAANKRVEARAPVATESFNVWRAVVKTVTFRVALTTIDFGANYFVIGELATAAGLSGLSLVAGPVFYFVHEAAWHHYGTASARQLDTVRATPAIEEANARSTEKSLALGNTITYEAVTAISEFGVNYFVVRDFAAAAGLAAFSVVISPLVYFAHEKAWEHYDATKMRSAAETAKAPT
jgi:uncharacterized membrane protein